MFSTVLVLTLSPEGSLRRVLLCGENHRPRAPIDLDSAPTPGYLGSQNSVFYLPKVGDGSPRAECGGDVMAETLKAPECSTPIPFPLSLCPGRPPALAELLVFCCVLGLGDPAL